MDESIERFEDAFFGLLSIADDCLVSRTTGCVSIDDADGAGWSSFRCFAAEGVATVFGADTVVL